MVVEILTIFIPTILKPISYFFAFIWLVFYLETIGVSSIMIWWLAFEKKPFQSRREIWIQLSYYSCTSILFKKQASLCPVQTGAVQKILDGINALVMAWCEKQNLILKSHFWSSQKLYSWSLLQSQKWIVIYYVKKFVKKSQ